MNSAFGLACGTDRALTIACLNGRRLPLRRSSARGACARVRGRGTCYTCRIGSGRVRRRLAKPATVVGPWTSSHVRNTSPHPAPPIAQSVVQDSSFRRRTRHSAYTVLSSLLPSVQTWSTRITLRRSSGATARRFVPTAASGACSPRRGALSGRSTRPTTPCRCSSRKRPPPLWLHYPLLFNRFFFSLPPSCRPAPSHHPDFLTSSHASTPAAQSHVHFSAISEAFTAMDAAEVKARAAGSPAAPQRPPASTPAALTHRRGRLMASQISRWCS